MQKHFLILALCALMVAACGKNKTNEQTDENGTQVESVATSGMSSEDAQKFDEASSKLKRLERSLNNVKRPISPDDIRQLQKQSEALEFTFDADNMSDAALDKCDALHARIDSVKRAVETTLDEAVCQQVVYLQKKEQQLLEGQTFIPVYLERGDKLLYFLELEKPAEVKLYNADSRQLLKTYTGKRIVHDSLAIRNKATYLLVINPKGTQYADYEIAYRPGSVERFLGKQYWVDTQEIEAQKGEFLAYTKPGIQMHNLFEEPRKFTLRSQLKAAFSSVTNSDRAIVAVQVPKGATDILYSLRIDTNEKPASSDGEFYDNMELSYRRIKVLGLPVYESHRGAGIISTLLGENVPPRKEDAYINMYVFYNAAQAKKFQDGANPANLAYSIDYSTMGTQSCNGRIPSKGNRTIYLGFQNERVRYTNYIWLEAVSVVPISEYYTTKFIVKERT